MLFNSLAFFEFLCVVYVLYWALPFAWQNRLLLAAGYVFYGCWDVRFLFLIAFSTAIDFSIGVLLDKGQLVPKLRRTVAVFLLGSSVAFLCPDWHGFAQTGSVRLLLHPQPLGLWSIVGTAGFLCVAKLLIDHIEGRPHHNWRRTLIFASVLVNLTFLGIFKYFNFFIDSAADLLAEFGLTPETFHLHIVLPVGISFYTFQSLSYTIDIYRRRIRATASFWDFALFVAYFPPMVAGPIERARHLLPQLTRPRRTTALRTATACSLIMLGLFKKVGIADGIAPAVASVYGSTGAVSQFDVVVGTLLFAIQILCDFSGYSDIARGVSRLLGIELMLNFNLPYFSQDPSEFWRRWHISLSSWLRDYLYIPLGGSRGGSVNTQRNLFLTMLLGGLWHGAAWNFVLWGGYQGLLLMIYRWGSAWHSSGRAFFRSDHSALLAVASGSPASRLPEFVLLPLRIGGFFILTCYGWLLFRAGSFDQIVTFTQTAFGFGADAPSIMSKPTLSAIVGVPILCGLQIEDYRKGRLESYLAWPAPLQGLVHAVLLFVILMGTSNAPVQFIYFQF